MKNLMIVGLVVLSMAVAACGGKSEKRKKADFLIAKFTELSPSVGIKVAKYKTDRGGNWVVLTDASGLNFIAINLDIIEVGMNEMELGAALSAGGSSGQIEGVSRIGTSNKYLGSSSGQVYEETAATSKDLEKAGAAVEAYNLNHMAQALSANYGLSEERGFEVAKLAMNWTKLSKTRSMTEADADAFATDMAGFDFTAAQAAYERAQAGDSSALNALIEKAAGVNGVSPEQMSRIVSEVIAQ